MEASRKSLLKLKKKQISIKVKRYRPTEDSEPYFQEYKIPVKPDMVVLDALNYIKDNVDGSLTYRWSCRMGVCGSCGSNVNGKPKITCETFIDDVGDNLTVEPMARFPIIKDLVVDIDSFMTKLKDVKPWIINETEKPIEKGENLQTPEQVDLYKQQSMCINCMLCYSACPVVGTEDDFIGPAALALSYRYNMDSRDQGEKERLKITSSEEGVYGCSWIGECTSVCPKNVDPAIAIQKLKLTGSLQTIKELLLPKFVK